MMTASEQRLLAAVARDETPAVVLESGTTVDVGQWFQNGRVWIACFAGRVAVFADGKRPHSEEIPVAELAKSFYNFLTGELALAPAPLARVRRLQFAPLDANKILEQINRKETSHD
ncbi:MAG: hypothetical protein WCG79_02545 [Verrucomicrobiota bacterium]|jgi:hypothetical protein